MSSSPNIVASFSGGLLTLTASLLKRAVLRGRLVVYDSKMNHCKCQRFNLRNNAESSGARRALEPETSCVSYTKHHFGHDHEHQPP